jgi:hypothetical protein
MNYAPGTRVRSFDFPGRTDCYVEGMILGITRDETYILQVDRRIVGGEERPVTNTGCIVYPPLNGRPTLMGSTTEGVVKLDDQTSPIVHALAAAGFDVA